MNIEQIINDKIGRKQIIAITAMVMLDGNAILIAMIAVLAILTQLFSDWKFPRNRNNGEEKT